MILLIRGSKVFTTFCDFESFWEEESEALEQDGLVFGWLGDAAFADLNAALGRQYYIHQRDGLDFIQHLARLVSEAGLAA